jgi:hypothetical protein
MTPPPLSITAVASREGSECEKRFHRAPTRKPPLECVVVSSTELPGVSTLYHLCPDRSIFTELTYYNWLTGLSPVQHDAGRVAQNEDLWFSFRSLSRPASLRPPKVPATLVCLSSPPPNPRAHDLIHAACGWNGAVFKITLWEERERKRAEFLLALDDARVSLARGQGRATTQDSMRQLANEVKERGDASVFLLNSPRPPDGPPSRPTRRGRPWRHLAIRCHRSLLFPDALGVAPALTKHQRSYVALVIL